MGYEGVGLLHTSPLGCFNPEEEEEKLHFIKMKHLAQAQQISCQGRHPPCADTTALASR